MAEPVIPENSQRGMTNEYKFKETGKRKIGKDDYP